MTTTHANCSHANTPGDRAICRRFRASGQPHPWSAPPASDARTDVHRPAELKPEDYDFSHTGSRHEDTDPMTRRYAAECLRSLIDQGYRWAAHHGAGKCDHCGTNILHYAVMIHRPTRTLIEIGERCLDNRFELANHEFAAMQKRLKAARVGKAKQARQAKMVEDHPLLAELQAIHNEGIDSSFLGSLAYQFIQKGELSEKQIAAAEKAILREAHTEALRENERRDNADVPGLIAERRVIAGTIISKKWKDSSYGSGSWKIVVKDDEGRRYYGTLPSAACDAEQDSTIELTATIKPSDDDPHFGFFSRPTLKG